MIHNESFNNTHQGRDYVSVILLSIPTYYVC